MMRRLLPFLLISVGAMLLVFAAGYVLFSQRAENAATATLPDRLAGLPLTHRISGRSAIDEINQLHGINFPLSYGLVGSYGNKQATIWVSGSPDAQAAWQMVVDMRDRIAEGRSPFTNAQTREFGKRLVYELDGLGQKHFYFQAGTQVIWVAIDPALAEQALLQALQYYGE